MKTLLKSFVLPLLILSFVFVIPSAFAQDKMVGPNNGNGKLRSCQAREQAIKTRFSHLLQLATNMQAKFDNHATKVETFYTTKVVPSGKSVPNYDALVADITVKKTAVQSALNKAQADSNFSCASANPKSQMTQFRQDMQAVKKALKEYRISIKNLIVAVRAVAPTKVPEPTK